MLFYQSGNCNDRLIVIPLFLFFFSRLLTRSFAPNVRLFYSLLFSLAYFCLCFAKRCARHSNNSQRFLRVVRLSQRGKKINRPCLFLSVFLVPASALDSLFPRWSNEVLKTSSSFQDDRSMHFLFKKNKVIKRLGK